MIYSDSTKTSDSTCTNAPVAESSGETHEIRNDWFAEDLVDIVLGEARTKVDGGFFGIFFTK